jgi:hypothetical protein
MRHAHRVLSLLDERCIIDEQVCRAAADQLVGPLGQHSLQRGRIPTRRSNEMVQLLDVLGSYTRGDRLNTLALPRAEQPTDIDRSPVLLLRVR